MGDNEYQGFQFYNVDTSTPNVLTDSGLATETIDLNRMFAVQITRTGSFDLSELRASTFGRLLNALPIPTLLVDGSSEIIFANRACGRAGSAASLEDTPFSSLFVSAEASSNARTLLHKVLASRKRTSAVAVLQLPKGRIWGRLHIRSLRISSARMVLVLIEDFTAEKTRLEQKERHEKQLQEAHDALEVRVKARTTELVDVNHQLRQHISELNRAEQALKKSKDTFEALLNAITDVVVMVDSSGHFLACNPPAAQNLGMKQEELVGKSLADVFPQDQARLRNGRIQRVVESGQAMRFEEDVKGRNLDYSLYPVFGAEEAVESVVVIVRDVTEQKKAQELLVKAERMKALGEMASGVAHNFNNMLQVIMGGAQLAMMNLEAGKHEDVKNILDQILESSRLGSDTVKWLQEFAGVRAYKTPDPNASFDLSEIVGAAIEISRQWWEINPEEQGTRISLRQSLLPKCQVQGNDEEIFETVVNLIKHSVESLNNGGVISIQTLIEGDRGILRVEDNGPSLSEEDRSRLLEPAWNPKHKSISPLANCLARLTKQQVDINIDNLENSGTAYTIRLQLVGDAQEIIEVDKVQSTDKPLRVLIIDDIEAILTTVQQGLTHFGHTVFCASSGEEGLTIFKETEVDAVVCDLGMPYMNGWDVGRSLKEFSEISGNSKIPFILMTGWGGQALSQEKTARCGVDLIVEKPVRIPQLIEAIREISEKSHGN